MGRSCQWLICLGATPKHKVGMVAPAKPGLSPKPCRPSLGCPTVLAAVMGFSILEGLILLALILVTSEPIDSLIEWQTARPSSRRLMIN